MEAYAVLDSSATKSLGASANMSMTLANHPSLAKAFYTLGRHLLLDSSVPHRLRELVTLRVAIRVKSEYEWYHHVRFGKRIGLTDAEIEAIRLGAEAPNWADDERAVLRCVDDLLDRNRIEDATWRDLNRALDRRQVMDLVATIGNYVMTSWLIAGFGVAIEPGFEDADHPLG